MMTTREFAEKITSDGFAVIPHCLEMDQVQWLKAALGQVDTTSSLRRGDQVYAIRNLLDANPAIHGLANSNNIRRLVEPVLGAQCFIVKATLFDKRAEANWNVPFHQDLSIAVRGRVAADGFRSWSEKKGVLHVQPPIKVLEGMLALRIHLDDCDESNAPLRVISGSHLYGRLGDSAIDEWTATHPFVSCSVPQGGVLAMRPLLLHASSPAITPRRRRVIHLEFAAEKLPGGLQWHHISMASNN